MGISYTEHPQDRMVEVQVDGGIGAADINRVMPRLRAFMDEHEPITVLEVVRRLGLVNVPAALPHALFGMTAVARVRRVALATDLGWLAGVTRMAALASPVEIRVFPLSEVSAARDWLLETEGPESPAD